MGKRLNCCQPIKSPKALCYVHRNSDQILATTRYLLLWCSNHSLISTPAWQGTQLDACSAAVAQLSILVTAAIATIRCTCRSLSIRQKSIDQHNVLRWINRLIYTATAVNIMTNIAGVVERMAKRGLWFVKRSSLKDGLKWRWMRVCFEVFKHLNSASLTYASANRSV